MIKGTVTSALKRDVTPVYPRPEEATLRQWGRPVEFETGPIHYELTLNIVYDEEHADLVKKLFSAVSDVVDAIPKDEEESP